ncbi:MAG TPA: glycosyltransferase family 4 protein [Planctomycetota bacterium]|nr:glycosyltransferase family 4 protein [Planctomycetota bacterium]
MPGRICVMNGYLDGRESDIEKGLYPRHHLWGADALARHGYDVSHLPAARMTTLERWARSLSAASKGRIGNLRREAEVLEIAKDFDALYLVTGELLAVPWLRAGRLLKSKIAVWVYGAPKEASLLKLRPQLPEKGLDGILCLTRRAAESWTQRSPESLVQHVDWGVDLEMFRASDQPGEYFLCCGRTQRDYKTLLAAAAKVNFPFKFIIPESERGGLELPANVQIVGGPKTTADDKGLPYPELLKHYHGCRAVLIALYADPNNTAGCTNALEAMACGKPLVMTRTGCLELNLRKREAGIEVEPGDVDGWVQALRLLADDAALARRLGANARAAVDAHYNLPRFEREVCSFFDRLLTRH